MLEEIAGGYVLEEIAGGYVLEEIAGGYVLEEIAGGYVLEEIAEEVWHCVLLFLINKCAFAFSILRLL